MADCEELRRLLESELIPDLEEAIDELFETVADARKADEAAKQEYAELQELRTAFLDLLHDLEAGEVDESECAELYRELTEMASSGSQEE